MEKRFFLLVVERDLWIVFWWPSRECRMACFFWCLFCCENNCRKQDQTGQNCGRWFARKCCQWNKGKKSKSCQRSWTNGLKKWWEGHDRNNTGIKDNKGHSHRWRSFCCHHVSAPILVAIGVYFVGLVVVCGTHPEDQRCNLYWPKDLKYLLCWTGEFLDLLRVIEEGAQPVLRETISQRILPATQLFLALTPDVARFIVKQYEHNQRPSSGKFASFVALLNWHPCQTVTEEKKLVTVTFSFQKQTPHTEHCWHSKLWWLSRISWCTVACRRPFKFFVSCGTSTPGWKVGDTEGLCERLCQPWTQLQGYEWKKKENVCCRFYAFSKRLRNALQETHHTGKGRHSAS